MSERVADTETVRSDLTEARDQIASLMGEVKDIKAVNERTSSDYLKFK